MNSDADKIAVVGMGCRFPGARNLEEFWKILVEGKDTITHFTDEELAEFEYDFENLRRNPDYVKAKGIINDIDKFDPAFFGYLPKEAEEFDPQYRIWLETVWHAFENAGCDPFSFNGKIGVFAGGSINTYLLNNVLRDSHKLENYIRGRTAESFQTMIGNEVSNLPTKTAYKFNLKGPAINVQTACSTSLVAVSMACQSLLLMDSDICVAGGVSAIVPQKTGYIYQEGGIPSPDGTCRPFDSEGKGTVFSNGVGVVVLKRLEDAIRDNDLIYAVVSGWALNNDGNSKVSYTAPSIDGQTDVIKTAQSIADISPDQIGYIEAHGTATQLGDPIELRALTNAFSNRTSRKQFCGIGSVKSNIGHTDVAAGIAGFIKAALSVYHKTIPPTIHFNKPNPFFNFEDSPFYVQDKLKKWDKQEPLIIGISSFGIGGTNAHVIIEEPAKRRDTAIPATEWPELVVLSAKSSNSLANRKSDLNEYIRMHPELNIHEVAYTLKNGRNHMKYRTFTVVSDTTEILSAELKYTDGKTDDFVGNVAFMFPGQGAQYYRMGYDLYNHNSFFREILDDCFGVVTSETGIDLKKVMFTEPDEKERHSGLNSTDLTQPALFIIEYALSRVLMQLGIEPYYLIGHSIGEYTAACIAGVFDLHTALKIVLKRGMLMKQMSPGEMMAIKADRQLLESLDQNLFEIAADNADDLYSISIKADNVDSVRKLLDDNGIQYTPLKTSHAFHSSDFDPMLQEFSDYVNKFKLNIPHLPFISCLTGDFITDDQAVSGDYWAQQLRNTVLFRKGIATLNEIENVVLLEVGPNTHLSSLAFQNAKVTNKSTIIHTLGKPDKTDERVRIISSLGRMFNLGISVDLNVITPGYKPQKISLPSYPFERIRCWLDFRLPEGGGMDEGRKLQSSEVHLEEKMVEDNIAASVTGTETTLQRVTNIWESLFGLENLSPDDNFFELGGHSLLALQILNRIKEDMHNNIPLKTFLDNPTINSICSLIDKDKIEPKSEIKLTHLTNLKNLPLSNNQKRLWILYKMDSRNPAYNIPSTYHFHGKLNTDVFEKSIDILFQRHHTVFSTFKEINGNVFSEIIPRPVNVELVDFSNIDEQKRKRELFSFVGEDSRKPFDLESGPLYRLYMLKYDDKNYYFHSTINHIIFDGWSWGVLVNDLNIIYNSLISGKEPELKELMYQYYDYAEWEKSDESKKNSTELAEFWVNYMKDCPPVLNFPFDRGRVKNPSGFGGKEYIRISENNTARLKEITRQENSTIFATILSAIGVLIQKYSGENDICLGTPVANRPTSHLEDVFGMFINTIPVRMRINENISFKKLIKETRASAIDAISHQELPFEKIVEALNPVRAFNINPLFQVCFAWQNNLSIPLDLEGFKGERVVVGDGISPFDLTFYMWENGDFIEGEVEYNLDILNRDTVRRLLDNFNSLLDVLVESPGDEIGSLSIISDEEKAMIEAVNSTSAPYSEEKTILNLFEESVALNPDMTALIFDDGTMTYAELGARVKQFTAVLQSHNIGSGDLVGIMLRRSPELIICLLALFKTGAVYVPLNLSDPDNRIISILEKAQIRFLITNENKGIDLMDKAERLNIEKLTEEAFSSDMDLKSVEVKSTDPAYIIFTSGTTGTPKGVLVNHKSVINLIEWVNITFDIKAGDKLLWLTNLSFDLSVYDIFGILAAGASVRIVSDDDRQDPRRQYEILLNEGITFWDTAPQSLLQLTPFFNRNGRPELYNKLRLVFLSGDWIPVSLPETITSTFPSAQVVSLGGATEATVWSNYYQIGDVDPEWKSIPYGKPIQNARYYILDDRMNHCRIKQPGNLYIGGDCLAQGYYNAPELTNSKFIPDPFNPGSTLYLTGDKAQWLADGNIEFLGREDEQVKVRGYRVEIGEIKNAVMQNKSIREAVVIPDKSDRHNIQVLLFITSIDNVALEARELKKEFRNYLPEYMIPADIIQYTEFPVTLNGKVDAKRLLQEYRTNLSNRSVSTSSDNNASDYESFSRTEKNVYDIWKDILCTTTFSIDDDFFDVGGNSLIAIRFLNKLEEVLSVSLTFREFLENSTIKQVSALIDNKTGVSVKDIKLMHLDRMTGLPLTLNQRRLWLISKVRPDMPSYIIPFSFKLTGTLDLELFNESINILFNRHHILFSVIREENGEPYCDIFPSEVKLPLIDYSDKSQNEALDRITYLFNCDSVNPFNLETGPLYRLSLFKIAESEYVFRICIHHIIFDGWSWTILAKDLNNIYNSLLRDKELVLDEIEYHQYDYAQWEQSPAGKRIGEGSVDFWKDNLKGASSVLNFPYDFQRNDKPTGHGRFEPIHISRSLTDKLRKISKNENASLFATFLCAYGIQLQKYSGEDDINIGLPVAYRPHSKLENIIGMFVNTVVVRLISEKGITFREMIHRANETALNAIAHQDLPFEKVVELISPERFSSANPIFQVAFDWQNNLIEPLDLEGIKSDNMLVRERTTVFDMTLYMWESGDHIDGEIEYNVDLLKTDTIIRFRDHFITLLNNLADNPDVTLDTVSMLTHSDRELIKKINDTKTDYPSDKTIVQLFEEQVKSYPDKTAVVFKDQQLTYRQLSDKSSQLAGTLRRAGVSVNTPVGILAEKSLDMIVAVMAALKAGGGYVPIDPDYPETRINFIIDDSGCKVLLHQDKYAAINTGDIRRISLNSPASYNAESKVVETLVDSSDLAYIMYTSGTTGMPKGSMIMQKSVIRLVRNTNYLDITPNDRILLTGAIVFDATTFEIWGVLLNGGTLYIAEKETILNPKLLGEELFRNDITIMWLTSGLFTQIAEIRTDIFGKLKYLLTGGDVLSAPHINMVRRDNPNLKIINGYGPTENTTFSTTYLIERDYDSNIPIGKPISNSTAYILDKNMNYQPVGVLGELYVGGDGLSKGYLNRDDLNSISFIDDPNNLGKRLYRTGDFARWLPDGNIEFHGRIDNQLKIRGFRVELGEIESVISEMEGVVETVIKPIKINEGDIRLAAFLNISDKFNMDKKELSKQLKEKLPPYMIPSGFKMMKGFPKTVNGKTDKDKLEFEIDELVSHKHVDVESLTSTERKIHEIWCEALKTNEISPDDNFFDIGGSSLTAVSVYSKIESAFNVDLGLRVFFDSPRIRDLAEAIEISIHTKDVSKVSVEPESEGTKIISGEI